MNKGIFMQAWEEAMQKHKVYKNKKIEEMTVAKQELRDKVSKKPTGILSGIGLYYLQRIEKTFDSLFSIDKKDKK